MKGRNNELTARSKGACSDLLLKYDLTKKSGRPSSCLSIQHVLLLRRISAREIRTCWDIFRVAIIKQFNSDSSVLLVEGEQRTSKNNGIAAHRIRT